jgi:hypothetical protein
MRFDNQGQLKEAIQKKGEAEHGSAFPNAFSFDSFPRAFNNAFSEPTMQTKLEIGQPGDQYEQEADAVADSVVGSGTAPSISSVGTSVQQSGEGNTASPELQSQINSSKGHGESLSSDTQKEMGGKIGADFSDVKVHRDSNASRMNEDLGSKAFTHGKDVYFNEGNYNPSSSQGKHLLAHELTHTVQQGGAGVKPKIQRSMKVEIQTSNFIWQKATGSSTFSHVPRKTGKYGKTETGTIPNYISTGKHGRKARFKGDVYYEEVKGDTVTKKIGTTWLHDPTADITKAPEEVKYFMVTDLVKNYKDTGKVAPDTEVVKFNPKEKEIPPAYHKKTLLDITEHPDKRPPDSFIPGTRQNIYYDDDTYFENVKQKGVVNPNYKTNEPLATYLDKKGRFVTNPALGDKKHVKHMVKNVKKDRWEPIDKKEADHSKAAEKVRYYRIPGLKGLIDSKTKVDESIIKAGKFKPKGRDILPEHVERKLEQTVAVPDSPPGPHIAGTKQFIYFDSKTYTPGTVNTPEDVYRDIDGKFVSGAKKHLTKQSSRRGVEIGDPAQFVREYKFTNQVDPTKLVGKSVEELIGTNGKPTSLKLLNEVNHAHDDPAIDYNKNTFELRYFNANDTTMDDSTLLQFHLDEKGKFVPEHAKLMRVARADINTELDAKHSRVFKVTEDVNPAGIGGTGNVGDASYFDPTKGISGKEIMVKLEEITGYAKDKTGVAGKDFKGDTYEMTYYMDSQFESDGKTLKPTATRLEVHLDDARLKPGHVKYMEQQISEGYSDEDTKKELGEDVDVGEEQTAVELQAEAHGFIEFETPKWYRSEEELALRVRDAYDMTQELNTKGAVETISSTQKRNMEKIKKADPRIAQEGTTLGEIRKWPASMLNTDVTKKLGKDLYVEIVDDKWPAFFQTSEGTSLSEVDSVMNVYNVLGGSYATIISDSKKFADDVFTAVKPTSTVKDVDNSLFADLKGFLQLITAYIMWGQFTYASGGKNTFTIMARNDYSQMYDNLLSEDERTLFKEIVSNDTMLSDDLKDMINELRKDRTDYDTPANRRDPRSFAIIKRIFTAKISTMTRRTQFFYKKDLHMIGRVPKVNPTIYSWLEGITNKKDKLAGISSAAIGGKGLVTTPGDKDYKQAMLEQRTGIGVHSHGSDHSPYASQWEAYARQKFRAAEKRASDTADDPTTADDESSKTSIKLE